MTRKQRRLVLIGTSLSVLAVAAGLILSAMRESIVFSTRRRTLSKSAILRVPGCASAGWSSPAAWCAGTICRFALRLRDGNTDLPVHYQGIVPDLFREGQGVVAEGKT